MLYGCCKVCDVSAYTCHSSSVLSIRHFRSLATILFFEDILNCQMSHMRSSQSVRSCISLARVWKCQCSCRHSTCTRPILDLKLQESSHLPVMFGALCQKTGLRKFPDSQICIPPGDIQNLRFRDQSSDHYCSSACALAADERPNAAIEASERR